MTPDIIIPMAGDGARFQEAGYMQSKPFIDFFGKMMIQHVIENLLPISDSFVFICKQRHDERMTALIKNMNINGRTVITPNTTGGAACSVLLAKSLIAPEVPIMIANCDQLVEYDPKLWEMHLTTGIGHSIWLFGPTVNPKWSYARIDNGRIVEVAEKKPISQLATTGHYFWRHWSDYVEAAEAMMQDESKKVNDEWYNAPVYNEAISRGQAVRGFYVKRMHGLGTPEDLVKYIESRGTQ